MRVDSEKEGVRACVHFSALANQDHRLQSGGWLKALLSFIFFSFQALDIPRASTSHRDGEAMYARH